MNETWCLIDSVRGVFGSTTLSAGETVANSMPIPFGESVVVVITARTARQQTQATMCLTNATQTKFWPADKRRFWVFVSMEESLDYASARRAPMIPLVLATPPSLARLPREWTMPSPGSTSGATTVLPWNHRETEPSLEVLHMGPRAALDTCTLSWLSSWTTMGKIGFQREPQVLEVPLQSLSFPRTLPTCFQAIPRRQFLHQELQQALARGISGTQQASRWGRSWCRFGGYFDRGTWILLCWTCWQSWLGQLDPNSWETSWQSWFTDIVLSNDSARHGSQVHKVPSELRIVDQFGHVPICVSHLPPGDELSLQLPLDLAKPAWLKESLT